MTLTAACNGKAVAISRNDSGNYMTLGKSLLGVNDRATVTVTAKYNYNDKELTASADIVIYDNALLKGPKGDTGVGWQGDVTEYAQSASGTTPPVTGWSATIPAVAEGRYLWTRVTTSYTDGSHTEAYSVSRMGKDGAPLTVTSTEVRYAVTTTASQPADTDFTYTSINAATPKDGDYVWCRVTVTYSDSTKAKSYSVSRIGSDGDKGNSLHMAYAEEIVLDTSGNAVAATGFSTTPFDGYGWIGTYADTNGYQPDSGDFHDYAWTRARGEQGSSYTENLLTGTRGFTDPWTVGNGSAANGSYEGLTIVECDLTTTGAAKSAYLAFRDYAFTDGETYTLSFWARTGVPGTRSYVHVPVPGVVVASDGQLNTNVSVTVTDPTWHMFELGATAPWRRYRITFKADSTVPFISAHNIMFSLYEGNAVQIAGVKLERGENAHTEWSPATEEMLGKDAVNIIVSPSSLVVNNNRRHTLSTTKVYVDLYDGDRQVSYGSGGDGFLCGTLTESTSTPIDPEGKVEWGFNTDSSTGVNRFFYYFRIAEGAVIDRTIPFTVTYKGRTYQSQLGLKTVSDGADGQDGKDAVTYDWLVSPDIIHCDYDGSVLTQTINVRCFRIEGTTRIEVKTGIRYRIGDRAFAALPSNGSIALMKSTLAGVTRPTMTLQLVGSDSAQTVLSEHVTGYICDGETGQAGPQGSVVRIRGLFTSGYYYDGKTADNSSGTPVYWLDVVWVENAAGTRYYKRCTRAGDYTAADGPHASDNETASGWANFSQLDNLIVELLIAKNAHIKFLNGQEIVFGRVENGVEKTWGRIGYPTQTDNLIMYAGGATSGLATFTLDKEGKARFGAMSGERIEIEPTDLEMRVFDGDNRQVATIDGKTHDINKMYGSEYTKKELGAQSVVAPVGETVTKRFDLDEFTVGDGGAAFSASVKANLYAEGRIDPGPGGITGIVSYATASACSAKLELYLISDTGETLVDWGTGEILKQPPAQDGSTDKTEQHRKAVTLSFGPRNLTKGKYQLRLTAKVENGKNGTAEANASVGLSGYARSFKAGNSPKALLCANGLIVANSTQDYLVAGLSGGSFIVEIHAGGRGIRVGQSGIVMQNDDGEWTQGFAEHCVNRALNASLCVGKTQGVRHWMTDSSTTGLPAGASKYGALTTYTIDNGGGNHMQEYRSFDALMQLWTRRLLNGTWTEWTRRF